MKERFEGDTGRRLLANELADQVIVHGNHDIADELLRATDPKNASLWAAALGPVCTQIKTAINNLGPR